jgi:hypothetical protein
LAALLKPLVRAIDWLPVAVVVSILAAVAALATPGRDLDPLAGLLTLRMGAVLLGAAAAFALVDAMTTSSGALPVPRWHRQWLRTLMTLAAVAVGWGVVYAIVTARLAPGFTLPLADMALEAAVCVLAGLAGSAFAVRRSEGRQAALLGGSAVPAVLLVGSLLLTGDLRPWPIPGEASWAAVHRGWLVALAVPLLVLLVANRDLRGRQGRRRRAGRPR